MRKSICGEEDCPTPYEFCEGCVRADEREKIAQAIEALPTWVIGDKATLAVDRFDAARIARRGGAVMAESWGPFHRHFASDAIHRDGGPECDQHGSPRPVIVFDPDYLREHDDAIRADERERIAVAIEAAAAEWYAEPGAMSAAARIARNGGSEE